MASSYFDSKKAGTRKTNGIGITQLENSHYNRDKTMLRGAAKTYQVLPSFNLLSLQRKHGPTVSLTTLRARLTAGCQTRKEQTQIRWRKRVRNIYLGTPQKGGKEMNQIDNEPSEPQEVPNIGKFRVKNRHPPFSCSAKLNNILQQSLPHYGQYLGKRPVVRRSEKPERVRSIVQSFTERSSEVAEYFPGKEGTWLPCDNYAKSGGLEEKSNEDSLPSERNEKVGIQKSTESNYSIENEILDNRKEESVDAVSSNKLSDQIDSKDEKLQSKNGVEIEREEKEDSIGQMIEAGKGTPQADGEKTEEKTSSKTVNDKKTKKESTVGEVKLELPKIVKGKKKRVTFQIDLQGGKSFTELTSSPPLVSCVRRRQLESDNVVLRNRERVYLPALSSSEEDYAYRGGIYERIKDSIAIVQNDP